VWGTADEAQRAIELAAGWVKENLTDRIKLRDQHTGSMNWEEEL